jgi:bacillithiol system protein YtxJ
MGIPDLKSEADFHDFLRRSAGRPAVLFKHSTRCPISAAALREFEAFAGAEGGVPCARVLVVEQRPLSGFIAEASGVRHESPQAILFRDGRAAWSASHRAITRESLAKACAEQR